MYEADETFGDPPDRPDITGSLPRYRLEAQLTQTGMSEVFHAVDLVNRRDVALKVIGPELLRQPGFSSRFDREAEIAATLKHPNIVDVYAAGRSDDGHLGYLAMRFIKGANLREVLEDRGRLDLESTVSVARQVAAALDEAHAHDLIHRDVKPGNILVEAATNRVYLCDFGIAKDIAMQPITATGAVIGTMRYLAPEQEAGDRDVDRRADVYSLGCVLYDCLAGLARTGTRGRRVYPVPLLWSPVDRVLRKAMDLDPARRHATCGELADDLAAAVKRIPRLRRLSAAVSATALGLIAALITAFVLVINGSAPDQAALDRVPAALRGDCEAVEPPMANATSALSCRDATGRTAVTALFADSASTSAAYTEVANGSGVARAQGDCAKATGAEHRYPATGPAHGQVLCYVRDGRAVITWTDTAAHTVSQADAPAADAAALAGSWSAWTDADPVFPTPDEQALLDMAAGTDCSRVSATDLDTFPAAVAGITCVPSGSGAGTVSYYRFPSLPDLRASVIGHVNNAKAPSGVACATGGAPGFLGTGRHDWLGVDLGQVLCRPGTDGTVTMEWSMEPLLIAGRVTGSEPASLAGWWSQWHLAPLNRIVAATNAQSTPPFPTQAERALLDHIPAISRINCVRPSPGQVWADVGAARVTAVACGRTSGAGMVVYYQFPDASAMRTAFNDTGGSGDDCTGLPAGFAGDAPYSRSDGSTGRLRCGVFDDTGERFLEWTDDQLAIAGYAHQGTEPIAMIDWWSHDAGPV